MSRLEASDGFSLLEVLVACALLATGIVTLAQLVTVSMRANVGSRASITASTLAVQKVEELRALGWGWDANGAPVSDAALEPSPPGSLENDVGGYVDYVDEHGTRVDGAGPIAFVRRWSVQTVPGSTDAIAITVFVLPRSRAGIANRAGRPQSPDEAWVATIRTRSLP